MPTTPVLTPSSSPRRRALHERTQSQTNERSSPPNIRLVNDQEDVDYHAASAYPTKPEQVLLPKPGKGQGFHDRALDVSDTPRSPSRATTTTTMTTIHPDDGRLSVGTASHGWERSSTAERTRSSSQVWGEDPTSSRSSLTQSFVLTDEQDDRHGEVGSVALSAEDEGERSRERGKGKATATGAEKEDNEEDAEEDEVIVLPLVRSTVKTVPPDPSSPEPQSFLFDDDIDDASLADDPEDSASSPNVVPIGLPSSPNFVPLDSSSPNLIPIGSSSPNLLSVKRSDSSIATSGSNSQGTVIRTYNRAIRLWSLSTDGTDSQLGSFRSSPPEPVLRSEPSASSFALPSATAESHRSRSATTSTRSVTSTSDSPATIETATQVQYATIRAPSSSGSWAESADPSLIPRPLWSMTDRPGRWNPRLSTVPSRWSAERDLRTTSPTESDSVVGPSEALAGRLGNHQTTSTIWLVDEAAGGRSDDDERLDSVSNLPRSPLHRVPSARAGHSRPESRSSLRRFGSNSSLILSTLPNWVRLYYRNDGQVVPSSALSLIDISPPSSRPPSSSRPTSPNLMITRVPTTISRPRTRPHENQQRISPQPMTEDPADPRSHWRPDPQGEPIVPSEPVPPDEGRGTWSPHLHRDRQNQNHRNMWLAPSWDSTLESFWGRRNIQVYLFCVGFIFPLAWFIAAFLPLPPKPLPSDPEVAAGESTDLRIQNRILRSERRRFENALWWRRLNRFMVLPGIVILIVIVSSGP
ncbi:hypothetical protein V8E54_008623 [Elaphomyces granulatus]